MKHLPVILAGGHFGNRVDVVSFGRTPPVLRPLPMIGYLSGAPLLPAVMLRQPDGRFVGGFGDAIVVDTARPTDESVQAATQAFAAQLEARIRANPHLWYQFYRYWIADEPGPSSAASPVA